MKLCVENNRLIVWCESWISCSGDMANGAMIVVVGVVTTWSWWLRVGVRWWWGLRCAFINHRIPTSIAHAAWCIVVDRRAVTTSASHHERGDLVDDGPGGAFWSEREGSPSSTPHRSTYGKSAKRQAQWAIALGVTQRPRQLRGLPTPRDTRMKYPQITLLLFKHN